jgi:hypothetical protein
LLKDKDVKKKVQDLGLGTDGSRQDLINRYQAYRSFLLAAKDRGVGYSKQKQAVAAFNQQQSGKGKKVGLVAGKWQQGGSGGEAGGSAGRRGVEELVELVGGYSHADLIKEAKARDAKRRAAKQKEQHEQELGQRREEEQRQQQMGGEGEEEQQQQQQQEEKNQVQQDRVHTLQQQSPGLAQQAVGVYQQSHGGGEREQPLQQQKEEEGIDMDLGEGGQQDQDEELGLANALQEQQRFAQRRLLERHQQQQQEIEESSSLRRWNSSSVSPHPTGVEVPAGAAGLGRARRGSVEEVDVAAAAYRATTCMGACLREEGVDAGCEGGIDEQDCVEDLQQQEEEGLEEDQLGARGCRPVEQQWQPMSMQQLKMDGCGGGHSAGDGLRTSAQVAAKEVGAVVIPDSDDEY